ncbi:hypothetical protein POVWA2_036900 [Plasmodium ovale wallikeri]|uniref:Uncharacterized protein n=1 Tax=Plasmodium ovale wallikeri TaxID=864142 RepID=A0A1A8Z591_PLAOA|nr:hypothetical protein POVWA2_036900 [Plasmodium ovale wallikeri]
MKRRNRNGKVVAEARGSVAPLALVRGPKRNKRRNPREVIEHFSYLSWIDRYTQLPTNRGLGSAVCLPRAKRRRVVIACACYARMHVYTYIFREGCDRPFNEVVLYIKHFVVEIGVVHQYVLISV